MLLRTQFLPKNFDPLGVYPESAKVQAHTRAFLVLSHAEIESYLEGWAKDIARACEVLWQTSNKVSSPLAFLFATMIKTISVPHNAQQSPSTPQRLTGAAADLFKSYYDRITDNNGIKEQNVLKLFAPLGMPTSALGLTLLQNLESFGERRGSHAHHSAAHQNVISVLDPETEWNAVSALLQDLTALDQWCVACRRTIR